MKLFTLLILFFTLNVSGNGFSQDNISIRVKKAEIAGVLTSIEKQTNYRFLYNNDLPDIRDKVSLNVREAGLEEVMDLLLQNTRLQYQVMENNLIVIKEDERIPAPAPDVVIRGRVTGEGGVALAGVSVQVKGTTTGTTTNNDGNFTITVTDANVTLVISSVGYDTQEIPLAGRTDITVALVTSTRVMEQVVVVGYGTARKKDLTGSVATVKGADIAKQPVLTATQAIQGKVAGVQIISSGDPNGLPTVRVRGTGTMLAGANPLYVVDGVITEDIRNINSSDIVSVEVLKDASATAIYGMRAANGVVLFTTKKGRPGKMVITYDATVGIKEATRLVNMAGANQYAGYVNEASIYYGTGDSVVTQAQMLAGGGNTDWYDAILKRGLFQSHNISLSGGSDKINYFLSAGYVGDEGIIHTNNFNRFTLRSNNEYKITSILKLSTLISYSRFNSRDVNLDVFNLAYRAAPHVASKLGDKYGNTGLSNNVGNPLVVLDKNHAKGLGNRVQGTFAIDLKPISWLMLRSSAGIDLDFYKNTSYGYKFANAGSSSIFFQNGGNQVRDKSSLAVTDNDAAKWVWDNTATFAKTFTGHNFNFLVGVTAEHYKFSSLVGSRFEVPEDQDQWFLNAGSDVGATNSNSGDKWTRSSFISRLNYNYINRYYLTATFRRDGTSRFRENNRWGNFPSVGVGWVISQESFLGDQQIFDHLKLRASWGKVGNDQIPTNAVFPIASINKPYFFDGTLFQAVSFDNLADENIRWETTEEFDLGLEFAVFNNRLTGEIDYYNKKTKDALSQVPIAGVLGDIDNVIITNVASFQNTGVEIALGWADKVGKDWTYNLSLTTAFNKNKVVGLNAGQPLFSGSIGGNQGFTTKTDNGQPIGSFFMYEMEGVFQDTAEISGSAQPGAQPGDLRYRDVNNDKVINDLDRTFVGSYQPKVTFGLNGGANFKSFDLSFGTYGTLGSKIYNGKKANRVDFRDNIETSVAKNRWTPNNPSTTEPRANLNQLPASTYFLEKGDFFRINNLTIGYSLPKSILDKHKVQTLRVYVTAQNLATITGYSGFTPEFVQTPSGTLAGGIELGIYPTTRTFAFGINLGF